MSWRMRYGKSWGQLGMKYKLSEVMDVIGGGTPKTSKPEYWNGDIPWLSVKDFNNDYRYVYRTEKSITKEGLENSTTKLLDKGDMIISARGTVGEVASVPYPMAFNQSCYGLRAKSDLIVSDFLYYLIKYNVNVLKKQTHGSVFDTITRNTFDDIEVDIPDFDCQKKIASLLSDLDAKIELNIKINENLLQQAQTLFYAWFVEYKPFGGIQPSDWKSISVYDLAEYINGAAFKKHEYADTGLPIIKIAELKNGITESTQHCCVEKDPKYYIKDRDILFSWSGNPETSIDTFVWSMGDAILNQHTFRVVSKYEAPAFTFFLLKYLKPQFTHIASNKQTTGLGHVTVKDLKRLQFCTDRQAIKDFNDLTMPIFEMIYSNCKESQGLSMLRDALLPKLMSGEIDISSLGI